MDVSTQASKLSRCSKQWVLLSLLITMILALGGCDALTGGDAPLEGEPATFDMERETEGAATQEQASWGPSVSKAKGGEGIVVDVTGRQKGDFLFSLERIAPGGTFTSELVGEGGASLARFTHKGLEDGTTRLTADLGALGAKTATVEIYRDGALAYRRASVPLSATGGALTIGRTTRTPNSFHYEIVVLDDGTRIKKIVTDNEMAGGAMVWPSEGEAGPVRYTHINVIPEETSALNVTVSKVRLEGAKAEEFRLLDAPSP